MCNCSIYMGDFQKKFIVLLGEMLDKNYDNNYVYISVWKRLRFVSIISKNFIKF